MWKSEAAETALIGIETRGNPPYRAEGFTTSKLQKRENETGGVIRLVCRLEMMIEEGIELPTTEMGKGGETGGVMNGGEVLDEMI